MLHKCQLKLLLVRELQGNQKKNYILSLYFSSLMRFSEANCSEKPICLMQKRLRIQFYEYRCSLLYQKKITRLHIIKFNIFPLNITQFSSSLCPTYTPNDVEFLLVFNNNRVQKFQLRDRCRNACWAVIFGCHKSLGQDRWLGFCLHGLVFPGQGSCRPSNLHLRPLQVGSFQEVMEAAATDNGMPHTYFSII